MGSSAFCQTINFKGCVPLFDDQFFTLNKTGTDSGGKNIYITTPVTGDQPCSGIGTCELKVQWNNTSSRWELLADTGNGDFVNTFLIFYSTTQNNSSSNPPNAAIGTWVENTSVTKGACGGNLTAANSTFTGDVRTVSLGLSEFDNSGVSIYPNPATEFLNITGLKSIKSVRIISADGKLISKINGSNKINIQNLLSGIYVLEIETENKIINRVKFIKK